jgi:hypothetical protein
MVEYSLGVGQGTWASLSLFPLAKTGGVKGWFDEQTRAKVHILPNPLPQNSTLLESISASSLPKQYGGQLAWEYADDPLLDQPETELLRSAGMRADEKFVTGPISLKAKEGGGWELERYGRT